MISVFPKVYVQHLKPANPVFILINAYFHWFYYNKAQINLNEKQHSTNIQKEV